MAYEFAGFFARPTIERPETLPQGGVWRDITSPFTGVGVRLPSLLIGDYNGLPTLPDLEALARQLGLHVADRWLYLNYVCWGGDIDFIYGLGSQGGVMFSPVEESEHGKVEAAYIGLMEQFGVAATLALEFEPFVRGYWGDA